MALRVTRVQAEVAGQATSGKLRVTRLQAEVAGQVTSGAVRLHKFAIQVLGTAEAALHEESATSVISLTHDARTAEEFPVSAENALSLIQAAISNIKEVSATSVIAATSSATGLVVNLNTSATHTLTLTSVASAPKIYRKTGTSTLSLTQEGRSNRISASAESEIVLTDAARIPEEYEANASSLITPDQTASATSLRVEAESTLELLSIADDIVKVRAAESSLSLTSTASSDRILVCSNTLSLTQEAIQGQIFPVAESVLSLTSTARSTSIELTASNTISFEQDLDSSIRMLTVESELSLEQTVTNVGPRYATAESELIELGEETFNPETLEFEQEETGLSQEATPGLIGLKTASNIISFAQWANSGHLRSDATPADAENILSLTGTAYRNITPEAESQLSLTSGVEGHAAKPASSELDSLGVEATVVVVRANLTSSNTLVVSHACAYVLEQSNTHCLYSPFVGASTHPDAPTPPSSTYTAAGATSGFRLQYPATGVVTDELVLRAPNLGNVDRLSMQRINRETRGGTLIVYADPIWPKVETLVLQFSGLSSAEAQSLLTFMEDHLGQEIKLVDWEDREWTGVISNPQDPIVQDRKGCQFTASFEFEGTKV